MHGQNYCLSAPVCFGPTSSNTIPSQFVRMYHGFVPSESGAIPSSTQASFDGPEMQFAAKLSGVNGRVLLILERLMLVCSVFW